MHHHRRAVGADPGGVGAENHRHQLLAKRLSLERPDVVMVQAHRLDLDVDPIVGRFYRLDVADLEDGKGILAVDSRGIDRMHRQTLAELGLVSTPAAIYSYEAGFLLTASPVLILPPVPVT